MMSEKSHLSSDSSEISLPGSESEDSEDAGGKDSLFLAGPRVPRKRRVRPRLSKEAAALLDTKPGTKEGFNKLLDGKVKLFSDDEYDEVLNDGESALVNDLKKIGKELKDKLLARRGIDSSGSDDAEFGQTPDPFSGKTKEEVLKEVGMEGLLASMEEDVEVFKELLKPRSSSKTEAEGGEGVWGERDLTPPRFSTKRDDVIVGRQKEEAEKANEAEISRDSSDEEEIGEKAGQERRREEVRNRLKELQFQPPPPLALPEDSDKEETKRKDKPRTGSKKGPPASQTKSLRPLRRVPKLGDKSKEKEEAIKEKEKKSVKSTTRGRQVTEASSLGVSGLSLSQLREEVSGVGCGGDHQSPGPAWTDSDASAGEGDGLRKATKMTFKLSQLQPISKQSASLGKKLSQLGADYPSVIPPRPQQRVEIPLSKIKSKVDSFRRNSAKSDSGDTGKKAATAKSSESTLRAASAGSAAKVASRLGLDKPSPVKATASQRASASVREKRGGEDGSKVPEGSLMRKYMDDLRLRKRGNILDTITKDTVESIQKQLLSDKIEPKQKKEDVKKIRTLKVPLTNA